MLRLLCHLGYSDQRGICTRTTTQTEEAFNYIVDELEYTTLSDGSCPLFTDKVGDFISDAECAHLSTSYI